MTRRPRECAAHQDGLESLFGDDPASPEAVRALDHLERCDACRLATEELALAVFALRRLGADAGSAAAALSAPSTGSAQPGATGRDDDTWPSLRARVTRRRAPAWRWRSQVAGVLLGAGLVAAVIGPTSVQSAPNGGLDEAGPIPGQTIDVTLQDIRGEEAWMRAVDRARRERPIEPATTTVRVDPRVFGDEALPRPATSQPARWWSAR